MVGTAIQVFQFEATPFPVHTQGDGNIYFDAAIVCAACEIAEHRRAVSRLDPDEKGVRITHTPGGPQQILTVTESGLWSLVLTSRKPAAKRFKKWLTSEVIPSIRKTGRYVAPSAPIANGDDDALMVSARNVVASGQHVLAILEQQRDQAREIKGLRTDVETIAIEVDEVKQDMTRIDFKAGAALKIEDKRTNKQKWADVLRVLDMPGMVEWSGREIARLAKVSPPFAEKVMASDPVIAAKRPEKLKYVNSRVGRSRMKAFRRVKAGSV